MEVLGHGPHYLKVALVLFVCLRCCWLTLASFFYAGKLGVQSGESPQRHFAALA